jgi:LCP family protein required for cell wall assembly
MKRMVTKLKQKNKLLIFFALSACLAVTAYGRYWQILNHPEIAFRPAAEAVQASVSGDVQEPANTVIDPEPGESTESYAADASTEPVQPKDAATAPPASKEASEMKSSAIHFLFLGTDGYNGTVSRTDVMIFVAAHQDTKKVSVISIPRDTRVYIEGVGLTKINHANALGALEGGVRQGTQKSIQAASNLLGVPINYYAKIDYQGFVKAVDAVGGIDITLPATVNDPYVSIYLTAGQHHLNGEQALRLARARKTVKGGDFGRQRHQVLLMTALAKKLLSPENINKLPEIFEIVQENLTDTNLSVDEALALGIAFSGIDSGSITYNQLPGHSTMAWDPVMDMKLFFYEPDPNEVRRIVEQAVR